MQDALIVDWSNKKFSLLIGILIIGQIICILIGGFIITPNVATSQNIIGIACKDNSENVTGSKLKKLYYTKGKGGCEYVDMYMYDKKIQYQVFHVVYTIQISLNHDDSYDYSRLQQNLIGFLRTDIIYQRQFMGNTLKSPIIFDATLAYRNKNDRDNDWKHYASSRIKRILQCSTCDENKHYNYDCMPIPLFELHSLYHDYYLLNIRFPIVSTDDNINEILGYMTDLWLTVSINENVNFIKVWINLQTIFFPIVIGIVIWYWRRINRPQRSPILLQYMVLALGLSLSFLNIPLQYLTYYLDMPNLLLLNDIKQGIFYEILLSFCLIFVSEHLMIQNSNSLKCYWRHLSAVFFGCLSLFIYNIYEQIVRLNNPFFSISIINYDNELASPFVTLAGILAGVYLILLLYIIHKVFVNISVNKAVLPCLSPIRRLHYQDVIYRFKFLIIVTLLCALLTIIGFIHNQMAKSQWKWNNNYELDNSSSPGAFYIGIYAMWNIYTIALLCLYAPSYWNKNNG